MNRRDIILRTRAVWPDPRRLLTLCLMAIAAGFSLSTLVIFS